MKKTILSLILLGNFSIIAQNLDSGLVGCYPFSGNVDDFSGNNNNAALIGPTLTIDRFGQANNAFHFNGTSDYIAIPSFSAMVPQNEITISIWAKADIYTNNCVFMLYQDNNSDRCTGCANYNVSGNATAIWDYGDIMNTGRQTVSTGAFSTSWEHYVFTTSQTGNIKKIYKNGIEIVSSTYKGSLINHNRTLYIGGGSDANNGNIRFHGDIDDVRIYNRALNATEVQELYSLTQGAGCISTGIKMEQKEVPNVVVYPNPFTDKTSFIVNNYDVSNSYTLFLYDVFGREVFRKEITQEYTFVKEDFPSGIYVYKVEINNSNWFNGKVVIQ